VASSEQVTLQLAVHEILQELLPEHFTLLLASTFTSHTASLQSMLELLPVTIEHSEPAAHSWFVLSPASKSQVDALHSRLHDFSQPPVQLAPLLQTRLSLSPVQPHEAPSHAQALEVHSHPGPGHVT
jgi:hypothetical protein